MLELYNAAYISLHVRETNFAAFHLYRDTLKFAVNGTEAKYYADGENAFDMRKVLTREVLGLPPLPPAPAAEPAGGGGGGGGAGGGGGGGGGGGKRGRAGGGAGARPPAEGAAAEEAAAAAAEAAAGAAADIEPGRVGAALAAGIAAIELD